MARVGGKEAVACAARCLLCQRAYFGWWSYRIRPKRRERRGTLQCKLAICIAVVIIYTPSVPPRRPQRILLPSYGL